MNFLGREGYRDLAAASMRARNTIIAGLSALDSVHVNGRPPLYAFSWTAEGADMGAVAAAMGKRGWMCGQTTHPPGIHVMATPVHEASAKDYVAAAAESIAEARESPAPVKAAAYN
jgi:glutamate/tyrosine decarboxylase-like PLP-dependent enzyme